MASTGKIPNDGSESEDPLQMSQERILEALETARDVVKAFGDFMQSPDFPPPGCVADIGKLPFDKELLKGSLRLCIRLTENEEHRGALRAAYVSLGDFQEGVGEEYLGVTVENVPEIANRDDISPEEAEAVMALAAKWERQLEVAAPFLRLAEREKILLRQDVAADEA